MRALVLCLVLAAAGCVSPPPSEGDEQEPDASGPTFLRYSTCEELLGVFPVQADAVELPEGWSAGPFLGNTAAVGIVAWSCAEIADDANTSAEPFTEAFAGFSVDVPEELRSENASFHMLFLGATTGSPIAAAAYEAWGVPVEEGSPTFSWQATPLGGTGTTAGTAGPLDIDMRVNAGGPDSPEADGSARFFVVEEGTLVAIYDVAWINAQTGYEGQATSAAALPGGGPLTPGLGFYYANEGPRYLVTPIPLSGE